MCEKSSCCKKNKAKSLVNKNENKLKPNHYKLKIKGVEFEVKDIMKSLNREEYISFCKMNIIKYVLRADKKNGKEDWEKARKYIGYMLEEM